jgi:prepilin-type N-terminal cleavage/methylation domain-containing protein
MTLFPMIPRSSPRAATPARQAFTLVEVMISMGIFSMVTLGMISLHLFGQRQDQLVQSKLGASDQSRRALNLLTDDIRAAKIYSIGNGSSAAFTAIANGTAQQGNAVKLQPTTATNTYIVYYFDTTARKLYRQRSGSPLPARTLIASGLTNVSANSMSFRGENYRGVTQTDLTHKGVVSVLLEFAEYQYPYTQVGPGLQYDYYKMEFKLTPHVPDGP